MGCKIIMSLRCPQFLVTVLLLTLSGAFSSAVEPSNFNGSESSGGTGAPLKKFTSEDNIVARTAKAFLTKGKDGFDLIRKAEVHTPRNFTETQTVSRRNTTFTGKTAGDVAKSPPKRLANRLKRPGNLYTVYRHEGEIEEQQRYYNHQSQPIPAKRKNHYGHDYDHGLSNYDTDYSPLMQDYDDGHNTFSKEQLNNVAMDPGHHLGNHINNNIDSNIRNNGGYDTSALMEPWRVTYFTQDPGYFGPPITEQSVYHEPMYHEPVVHKQTHREPGIVTLSECDYPDNIRTHDYNHRSVGFKSVLYDLGHSLWDLFHLIAHGVAPFIIPILALKLIIVPIKILKFLKLIKLFIKIFIILPFFLRVIYPALSTSLNLQKFLYKMNDQTEPMGEAIESEVESRDGNASTALPEKEEIQESTFFDLRQCPSRVACELGAYLGTSSYSALPKNIASYLERRAKRAQGNRSRSDSEEQEYEENDEEEEEEEEYGQIRRDEAFKAFVIALGKKWTLEKCQVYSCAILF